MGNACQRWRKTVLPQLSAAPWNPVIDALRRNENVDFVHVRNDECGVFAAVADAYFTGAPVAVCGAAGTGVIHLFNGLMDARFGVTTTSTPRVTHSA
jgi:thiamine pyrophosphate-dependent acetolactate synthase large subunit-like protein